MRESSTRITGANNRIRQETGFAFNKDNCIAMHPDGMIDWLNKFSEDMN